MTRSRGRVQWEARVWACAGCLLAGACSGDDPGDDGTTAGTAHTEGDHDSVSASGVSDGVGTSTTGPAATGDLTIRLTRGAGVAGGATADGWVVTHAGFVVSVGRAAGGGVAVDERHVVDLVDHSDVPIGTLRGLPAGRVYSATAEVGPVVAPYSASTVGPGDLYYLLATGASVLVEGTLENPAGVSCTPGDPDACVAAPLVLFRWAIEGMTTLVGCEGVGVESGGESVVSLEVRGDRWLRAGFTGLSGAELRAQWIADADLDHDGKVTLEELTSIKAADLFGAEYDLSEGAPFEIVTAYDFLRAQVVHLGECQ